ncbi:MAG TPA: hypothetical protein DEU72_04540 [Desulfomicrobiaceae bacterium]|jgi:LemA protein|nr:hypothetical protein [Desulfomicrobiaceae bacterium]
MLPLVLLAALGLGLTLWAIAIYNGLVRRRNIVDEAWSGVEVQLKRRADLIPNIVATVEAYAGHEQKTLAEVVRLRNQAVAAGTVEEAAQTQTLLSAALGRLFALAENYPQLKANENFLSLQTTLSEIEEQLQLARRYYNGAVRDLNIAVESFPSNLVAGRFGFTKAPFFELEDPADRNAPHVRFGS